MIFLVESRKLFSLYQYASNPICRLYEITFSDILLCTNDPIYDSISFSSIVISTSLC